MEPRIGAGRRLPDVEPVVADRKLPQSIEAEQCVLGAILLDASVAPSILNLLRSRDFYSARHQKIYDAIQAIYDQLATVDPVLVRDALEQQGFAEEVGGMDYLEELMGAVATVANAEYHGRTVRGKAILRRLITVCTEIIQAAYDSEEPAASQLDRAEQQILEVGHSGETQDFIEIQHVIDEQFEKIDDPNARLTGLDTGFHKLDELTTGLHPAEFIIVAGRPSMGKTSFALNVVERVASAGKGVAIFSLEVSKEQLVQNLLCSSCRVSALDYRRNTLSDSQFKKLTYAAERLRDLKIFVNDTPGLTPLSLKATARRLHSRHPVDLIVVDYLQLMETANSGENRQQEVSKISRGLKALARELDVPVVAISQLSRGVENRESHRPRLSDLRESGAIEQDADLVLLLYREEYYNTEKEEAKGKAEVIIAKQRNGPTGSVPLTFLHQYMRFENPELHHAEDPF